MQDFYLKFTSEAQANDVLYTLVDEEKKPNYRNIDVLGELYDPIPDPMPEGYSPVALPGWHVNVRVMPDEDSAPLEAFAVIPTNPRRVWA